MFALNASPSARSTHLLYGTIDVMVSYAISLLNFLFRKKGLLVRVYADHHEQYADFFDLMPETMEKEIAKATPCKRLINPADCNPRCVLGFDFSVAGRRYQKCRYSCFQFVVTPESIPVISAFLDKERSYR